MFYAIDSKQIKLTSFSFVSECQRRFICVKRRPSLYIFNLKNSKGADPLLPNSTAFFLHKCENQRVQWYNCVSRRCFSATLNKISNKNVTPSSESISKTSPVTPETELPSSRLQEPLTEMTSAGTVTSSGAEADAAEKKKNKLLRGNYESFNSFRQLSLV